jgi:DNA (cytosine-5)-methyltransferase 1
MKSNYAYTEVCGTLRAKMGDNQAAVAIENHPADSRIKLSADGVVQTLPSRMGTGGGNTPLVMDIPKVYGICSLNSNSMKSSNPHSGIYEADTSRTLDLNGGSPSCNQGGMAVVAIEGSGQRASHKGSGVSEDGVSFTINTIERHAVCYQDKVGSLCASDYKFPQQQQIEEGKAVVEREVFGNTGYGKYIDKVSPLKASGGDYPGSENVVVENRYVVRRLTPQECALLQGFPLDWCSGLETPDPTEDEIAFWTDVWETDRLIKGTSSKPKSRKQIVKWLKNPHSDSAEYKMWGNGVALPCVEFVLSGIVHFA